MRSCVRMFGGWSISETAILHSGLPFSVLSQPYTANGNGVFQANAASTVQFNAPAYANRVPGVPLYRKSPVAGVTVAGTRQWLNPDAFVSVVDPTTGACAGGDSPANCQFGNSGRNSVRGPHFTYSDIYITKNDSDHGRHHIPLRRPDVQRVQSSQLCSAQQVEAGVPGVVGSSRDSERWKARSRRPPGCLGVGLGGDSSPRMIAFQGRIEF